MSLLFLLWSTISTIVAFVYHEVSLSELDGPRDRIVRLGQRSWAIRIWYEHADDPDDSAINFSIRRL